MRNWNLYWVECPSPDENCFVIAHSSRSAACHEENYSGFNPRDCTAELVVRIPGALSGRQLPSRPVRKSGTASNPGQDGGKVSEQEWPGYAREWLLRRLGATFKMREDALVTVINGKSYRTAGLIEAHLGKPPELIRSVSELIGKVDGLPAGLWLYRGHQ